MGIATTGARILAVVSVLLLTAVMVGLALRPNWPRTTLQLSFLTAVIGFGWIGGFGVLSNRFSAVAIGVIGLALVGFWQAVLWIVVMPTALLLLVAGFAAYPVESETNRPTPS